MSRSSRPKESSKFSGRPTSMMRSVAAIAKTPSAKVSRRPGVTLPRSPPASVVLRCRPLEELPHPVVEEDEANLVETILELPRRGDRNGCGELWRIAVDPGGECRESDRAAAELFGDLERAPVRRGEELRLSVAATVPDRAHRVNHVSRGQPPGPGGLRIARRTTAEPGALV